MSWFYSLLLFFLSIVLLFCCVSCTCIVLSFMYLISRLTLCCLFYSSSLSFIFLVTVPVYSPVAVSVLVWKPSFSVPAVWLQFLFLVFILFFVLLISVCVLFALWFARVFCPSTVLVLLFCHSTVLILLCVFLGLSVHIASYLLFFVLARCFCSFAFLAILCRVHVCCPF